MSLLVYVTGLNKLFNATDFPAKSSLKDSSKSESIIVILCDANDAEIFGEEYEEGKSYAWAQGQLIGGGTYSKSSDATLSALNIDGVLIDGFNKSTLTYQYQVSGSTVPTVTATASSDKATVSIEQATEIGGEAYIVVTAEDGITEKVYTVLFVLSSTNSYLFNTTEAIGTAISSTTANQSWTVTDTTGSSVIVTAIGNKKAWQVKFGTSKTWQLDGETYSYDTPYYFYFSGTGTVKNNNISCALEFPVSGDCDIMIAATASGAGRYLAVYNDTTLLQSNVCQITTASQIATDTVSYTGGATTIRIISGNSGVDLYMVKIKYNS